MNTIKKVMLSAMFALAVISCTAGSSKAAKEKLTVQQQLDAAKTEGSAALVVVTSNTKTDASISAVVNSTAKELKNIEVVNLNVDDKANAELIKEYRLDSAPLPLMLIVSQKGLVMGGLIESQVTKENIVNAIPTPKYSEITYALSQGKPVLALVSNNGFASNDKALTLCNAAKTELNNNAEVITIDTKDTKESKLISMLNIKQLPNDAMIVAINGQGIMAGRFDKLPSQAELVEAATKVVQTGCSPGGCGPTCN